MAVIIETPNDNKDCIVRYVERAQDHVRMAEHICTEVLEMLLDKTTK